MIRTGIFKYVRHGDVPHFIKAGWLVQADLGIPHGEYSVLMWLCCGECREAKR